MAKNPRKARTPAPKDESKSDKFSRLASARVTKAVKAINAIGSLAARSYEYTDGQAQAIMTYLKTAIDGVQGRFAAPGQSAGAEEIKI